MFSSCESLTAFVLGAGFAFVFAGHTVSTTLT